jgi:hypothetical protein
MPLLAGLLAGGLPRYGCFVFTGLLRIPEAYKSPAAIRLNSLQLGHWPFYCIKPNGAEAKGAAVGWHPGQRGVLIQL